MTEREKESDVKRAREKHSNNSSTNNNYKRFFVAKWLNSSSSSHSKEENGEYDISNGFFCNSDAAHVDMLPGLKTND